MNYDEKARVLFECAQRNNIDAARKVVRNFAKHGTAEQRLVARAWLRLDDDARARGTQS